MNSVGNVARVLRLFTPDRGVLSVTEVAQLLALPKSSSSRLLKAMAETGLLATTESSSGYCVGNLIFETSRRHRVNSTLSAVADEALARIAKATGHTGYVAILDGTGVLGLRMRPGCMSLRVVTSPGDRPPAGLLLVVRTRTSRVSMTMRCVPVIRRRSSRRRPTRLTPLPISWRRSPGRARRAGRRPREPAGRRVDRRLRRGSRERRCICISYSAAMISANEKSRIVTLLMRAGCEVGIKFDDEYWTAPRFAAFAAPYWNEAA